MKIWFISLSILLILLSSCAEIDSDDQSFGTILVNTDEFRADSLLLSQIAGSKEIAGGHCVSFLKPSSKNSLDTVTTVTSEYKVLYLKDSSFNFVASFACDDSFAKLDTTGCYDTLFVNYGESRKMDYIPYQKVPSINKELLKKTFSTISREKDNILSDTIISSFKLQAKNFIDGIEFTDATVYPEYMYDSCRNRTEYPEHLKLWSYYLENVDRIALPKNKIVHWTLMYTDQYGRTDSLAMTTQFK